MISIRPRSVQFFINELPWLLLCLLCCAYWLMGYPYGGYIVLVGCSCAVCLIYRYVYLRNIVFRLSDTQLSYEHGIFSRTTDYMELYRINDITTRRTFMQMLCGLKTVIIDAQDKSTPHLLIMGVDKGYELESVIRNLVERAKRRSGVHEIANR